MEKPLQWVLGSQPSWGVLSPGGESWGGGQVLEGTEGGIPHSWQSHPLSECLEMATLLLLCAGKAGASRDRGKEGRGDPAGQGGDEPALKKDECFSRSRPSRPPSPPQARRAPTPSPPPACAWKGSASEEETAGGGLARPLWGC